MELLGIDYGSKLAGTTVLAHLREGGIAFRAARKGEDADQFILRYCREYRPPLIALDAPLSLPGVFRDPDRYDDYFYRQADRQAGAMSPMFLGGLTARAMRLLRQIESLGLSVVEVYPGYLAREVLSLPGYKKEKDGLPTLLRQLAPLLPVRIDEVDLPDWHHFDALLSVLSALRYHNGEHLLFGNSEEGSIVV